MKHLVSHCIVYLLLIAVVSLSFFGQHTPRTIEKAVVHQTDTVATEIFPQGYFVVPTDSFLEIAGNFGELRSNHFHTGLDVKTGGREGVHVLAVADGYISQIKISPYGYGKCLYITHPNGFVSVYGHCQRMYGKIADYLKREQYKAESYEVDLFPAKNELPVKQCDTVAISGNTGGSRAPHLHFEIRDSTTEYAYNPFLFGYKIDDTAPPILSLVEIYAFTDSSSVNGRNAPKRIRVYGRNGHYNIPTQQITVNGLIGFGINTVDYANRYKTNVLGVYSIEMYIDSARIYNYEMRKVRLDQIRAINSVIDYKEFCQSGRRVQQCFRDENNNLSIYPYLVNNGLYNFTDKDTHVVKFVVKDFFQNTSTLSFKIKSTPRVIHTLNKNDDKPDSLCWSCVIENKHETKNIKVDIDKHGLYRDLDFTYSESKDTLPGAITTVHKIANDDIPLQTPMKLSIRVKPLPAELQGKATIVWLDNKNSKANEGGTYSVQPDGTAWVTTETKLFGRFTVVLDTKAPIIRPYNIYNNKNMSRSKIIGVTVGDNLTGIKSYRATVDGKWILMEYEYKKALLFYEFGDEVTKGKHVFRLEVADEKNNVAVYKADFIR